MSFNFPDEWNRVPFHQLFTEKVRNGIYKTKEFHGSGTKVVNMGELFGYGKIGNLEMNRVLLTEQEKESFLLEPGDLIFARRSLVASGSGKCSIILDHSDAMTFESSIIRVRLNKKKVNPLFMYYIFNSSLGRYLLGTITREMAVSGITGSDLSNIIIPQPILDEQNLIADLLSSIDDKIELNNAINKNLEEMAQVIFKRWFIDFEFPNENGEPYKSSGGEFLESELGPIPQRWKVNEMGSFLVIKSKRVNGLDVVEYSTTTKSGIQRRDEKFKKSLSKNTDKNKIIEKNDIVFGNSRQILNFGVMKDEIGAVSSAYHVFGVKCEIYNAELLEMYMRLYQDYFLDIIKPGGRDNQSIDKNYLQKKKLIIPEKKVQDNYLDVVSDLKKLMQTMSEQTYFLTQIRDSLLPKLMTGDIRIPVEHN